MKKEELDRILSDHAQYLSNGDNNLRANLSEANLRGADLSEANLSEANLRGADLSEANLYEANLRGADLSGANLSEANLRGADLYEANLRGADLSGAKDGDTPLRKCKTILGLEWDIFLFNDMVIVGCKRYTLEEWLNFSDIEIANMDKNALEFYPVLKSVLEYEYRDWGEE